MSWSTLQNNIHSSALKMSLGAVGDGPWTPSHSCTMNDAVMSMVLQFAITIFPDAEFSDFLCGENWD